MTMLGKAGFDDGTFGRIARRAVIFATMTVLAACKDGGRAIPGADTPIGNSRGDAVALPMPAAKPAAATVPDTARAQTRAGGAREFLGTWTGPEGLSFVVTAGADGGYDVRNQDTLDDRTTFVAARHGDVLWFVRRGQALTARPGTGAETGFKWLANKRDCLIVQPGIEGYCRD